VVESTGLENRHTFVAYLGFKSLSLRHIQKASLIAGFFTSIAWENQGFKSSNTQSAPPYSKASAEMLGLFCICYLMKVTTYRLHRLILSSSVLIIRCNKKVTVELTLHS